MPRIKIIKSTAKNKKYTAVIKYNDKQNKPVIRHFGDSRYTDYTLTGDKDKRKAYRSRHGKEKDQKFDTAGALSYWILWGESTDINKNIADYKKRYDLKSL
jgi:hypothetical protein